MATIWLVQGQLPPVVVPPEVEVLVVPLDDEVTDPEDDEVVDPEPDPEDVDEVEAEPPVELLDEALLLEPVEPEIEDEVGPLLVPLDDERPLELVEPEIEDEVAPDVLLCPLVPLAEVPLDAAPLDDAPLDDPAPVACEPPIEPALVLAVDGAEEHPPTTATMAAKLSKRDLMAHHSSGHGDDRARRISFIREMKVVRRPRAACVSNRASRTSEGDPGNEALPAFGLLEFVDMTRATETWTQSCSIAPSAGSIARCSGLHARGGLFLVGEACAVAARPDGEGRAAG